MEKIEDKNSRNGKKRKIPMEKIENKNSRHVAFSKRRRGIYSKASELCLLSGAKIAILATPVSSESNVSFYSFGHSSVDSVVSDFLTNQRPRDDDNVAVGKELGFWWEDEKLVKSENPKELSDAIYSISSLLHNLKGSVENRREYEEDLKKKDLDQNQTLNFESCSESIGIQDDLLAGFEEFIKNSEEKDQIVAISDTNMKNDVALQGIHQELGQNQTLSVQSCSTSFQDVSRSQNPCSDSDEVVVEDRALVVTHTDFNEDYLQLSDSDENQDIASSDNNNNNALHGNFDGYNRDHVLGEFYDYLMNCEDFSLDDVSTNQNLCFDYEAVEDGGAMGIHRDFDPLLQTTVLKTM